MRVLIVSLQSRSLYSTACLDPCSPSIAHHPALNQSITDGNLPPFSRLLHARRLRIFLARRRLHQRHDRQSDRYLQHRPQRPIPLRDAIGYKSRQSKSAGHVRYSGPWIRERSATGGQVHQRHILAFDEMLGECL